MSNPADIVAVVLLAVGQIEKGFVHRENLDLRTDVLQRLHDPGGDCGVAVRPCRGLDESGAQFQGFTHMHGGLDPESTGFVATGDAAGAAQPVGDGDRTTPQEGIVELFQAGEEGVHVDERNHPRPVLGGFVGYRGEHGRSTIQPVCWVLYPTKSKCLNSLELNMTEQPTPRQQDLLDFIRSYVEEHDEAPSYREMADALGIKDIRGIYEHVLQLEQKGYVSRQHRQRRSIVLLPTPDADAVPVYGKVAAGLPLDIAAEVERTVTIPDGLFRVRPDFLLQVSGDSMVDIGIYDGDLAGVKRIRSPQHGQIVVAMVDVEEMSRAERAECGLNSTGITLKRLSVSGSKLLLKSENKAKGYMPLVVRPERVRIEGRFVGLVRSG